MDQLDNGHGHNSTHMSWFTNLPLPRVVYNPAILIPLLEKTVIPATLVVIRAIFESSGKK